MGELFRVRITVRSYELDPQGHLNGAVYIQYADHARFEYVRAAGVDMDRMLASGFGPVTLETTIRYRHELRRGDEIDVSCVFIWEPGKKTFRVQQELRRADELIAAEVTS